MLADQENLGSAQREHQPRGGSAWIEPQRPVSSHSEVWPLTGATSRSPRRNTRHTLVSTASVLRTAFLHWHYLLVRSLWSSSSSYYFSRTHPARRSGPS